MIKPYHLLGMRLLSLWGGNGFPRVDAEDGQTLAEYALILALIAVVVVVIVTALGSQVSSVFSQISSAI